MKEEEVLLLSEEVVGKQNLHTSLLCNTDPTPGKAGIQSR